MAQRIAFRIWFISLVLSLVGGMVLQHEFNWFVLWFGVGIFLIGGIGTLPGWALLWKVIDVCEKKQLSGYKVVFIVLVAALAISALNFYVLLALFDMGLVFSVLVPIVLIAVAISALFSMKLLFNLSPDPSTIQPDSHEN